MSKSRQIHINMYPLPGHSSRGIPKGSQGSWVLPSSSLGPPIQLSYSHVVRHGGGNVKDSVSQVPIPTRHIVDLDCCTVSILEQAVHGGRPCHTCHILPKTRL